MPDAIDWRPGDRPWLIPRSLAPHRECWRQHRVTVVRPVPPDVRVALPDGREITVAARDLTRTDPNRPRPNRPRPRPTPPADPAAGNQLSLWPLDPEPGHPGP